MFIRALSAALSGLALFSAAPVAPARCFRVRVELAKAVTPTLKARLTIASNWLRVAGPACLRTASSNRIRSARSSSSAPASVMTSPSVTSRPVWP